MRWKPPLAAFVSGLLAAVAAAPSLEQRGSSVVLHAECSNPLCCAPWSDAHVAARPPHVWLALGSQTAVPMLPDALPPDQDALLGRDRFLRVELVGFDLDGRCAGCRAEWFEWRDERWFVRRRSVEVEADPVRPRSWDGCRAGLASEPRALRIIIPHTYMLGPIAAGEAVPVLLDAVGDVDRVDATNATWLRPWDARLEDVHAFRRVSIGSSSACAVTHYGAVHCWGVSLTSPAGPNIGDNEELFPALTAHPWYTSGVKTVLVVSDTICVLLDHDRVRCSTNDDGNPRFGNPNMDYHASLVTDLDLGAPVRSIASSAFCICALLQAPRAGQMRCWGAGSGAAFFGLGTNIPFVEDAALAPVTPVGAPVRALARSLGSAHNCILTNTSQVRCWGDSTYGQLGTAWPTSPTQALGDDELASVGATLVFGNASESERVVALALGSFHSCAVIDDGAVICWGLHVNRQLGVAETFFRDAAGVRVQLGAGVRAADLVAQGDTTCALTQHGRVRCWGGNSLSPIGVPSLIASSRPLPAEHGDVPFTGLVDFVAVGSAVSCALTAHRGRPVCWGSSTTGVLGLRSNTQRPSPTVDRLVLPGVSGYASVPEEPATVSSPPSVNASEARVILGGQGSALLVHGRLYTWGLNDNGELGRGSRVSVGGDDVEWFHAPLLLGGDVVDAALSKTLGCAVLASGGVRCWGFNFGGPVFGDNEPPSDGPLFAFPNPITAVEAVEHGACAVFVNGDVRCWGYGETGRLGYGSRLAIADPGRTPGPVPVGEPVLSVSMQLETTVALTASRRIKAWGKCTGGLCGNLVDRFVGRGIPVNASLNVDLQGAVATTASVGVGFACVLLNTGFARCWGETEASMCGISGIPPDFLSSPRSEFSVSVSQPIQVIASGFFHSCTIAGAGIASVYCWGSALRGVLGLGSAIQSHSGPVLVNLTTNTSLVPVELSLSEMTTSVRFSAGVVLVWGANDVGQLGLGDRLDRGDDEVPASITTLPNTNGTVIKLPRRQGALNTCVLLSGGGIRCWGAHGTRLLGSDFSSAQDTGGEPGSVASTPLVALSGPARDFSVAHNHACAILESGSLQCWGRNSDGQLGNGLVGEDVPGDVVHELNPPLQLGAEVLRVDVNIGSTCVVLVGGHVRCVGREWDGKIGQGPYAGVGARHLNLVPNISIGTPVVDIFNGVEVVCALLDTGQLRCWGDSNRRLFGAGEALTGVDVGSSLLPRDAPYTDVGSSDVHLVRSGQGHSCAVFGSSRSLRCWGNNAHSALGRRLPTAIGGTSPPASFAPVNLPEPVADVRLGYDFTCALLETSGAVRCWGATSADIIGHRLPTVTDTGLANLASPNVPLPGAVASFDCAESHCCAVLINSRLECWGANEKGQLGRGHTRPVGFTNPVTAANASVQTMVTMPFSFADHGALRVVLPRTFPPDVFVAELDASTIPVRLFPPLSVLERALNASSTIRVHPSSSSPTECPGNLVNIGFSTLCAMAEDDAAAFDRPIEASFTSVRVVDPASGLLDTVGGSTIWLDGDLAWMSAFELPVVTVGGRRCRSERWAAVQVLECVAPPGEGAGFVLEVTVTNPFLPTSSFQLNDSSMRVSYAPPVVQFVLPDADLPADGSQPVRVLGRYFGVRADAAAEVFLNETLLTGCTRLSDAEVRCLLPPTQGTNVPLRVRLGAQESDPVPISFRSPVVTRVEPPVVLPANGSVTQSFLLHGSGFEGGLVGMAVRATVGGVACPSLRVLSSVLSVCDDLTLPSVWTSAAVELAIGNETFVLPNALRFLPPPSVGSVVSDSFPTAGNVTLRVIGDGFGVSRDDVERVFFSWSPDPVSFDWVSQFELRCTLSSFAGTQHHVVVRTVGGLESPALAFFQFDRPVVSAVAPSVLWAGEAVRSVVLTGENFGPLATQASLTVTIGGRACLAPLVSRASTEITCQLDVRDGASWPSPHIVGVDVAGRSSGPLRGVVDTLPAPQVSALASRSSSFSTRGGEEIRILGDGFGVRLADVLGVQIGSAFIPSSNVTFVSTAELRVSLPRGVGRNLALRVQVAAGLWSDPFPLSYDTPTITAIEPSSELTGIRNGSFILCGTNLGSERDDLHHASIGGVACATLDFVNESCIECRGVDATHGWPSPRQVALTVGANNTGESVLLFTGFPAPRVSQATPRSLTAGADLTIIGEGFGSSRIDIAEVLVGNVTCEDVQATAAGVLRCRVPPSHWMFRTTAPPDPSFAAGLEVVVWTRARIPSTATSASARVAPAEWAVTAPPTTTPSRLRAWRVLGVASTVVVFWSFPSSRDNPDSPDASIKSFRVVAVPAPHEDAMTVPDEAALLVGDETTGADLALTNSSMDGLFDLVVARGDARVMRTAPDGSERYRVSLSGVSASPLLVRVAAQNAAGDGPYADVGSAVPATCLEDEFLATHRPVSERVCDPCPRGAYCGGLRSANVTALAGFWRIPWSEAQLGFAACRVADACLGWEPSNAAFGGASALAQFGAELRSEPGRPEGLASGRRLQVADAADPTLVFDDEIAPVAVPGLQLSPSDVSEGCSSGYTGVLCGSCAGGFFRATAGECASCGSEGAYVGRIVGVLVLIGVLVGGFMFRAVETTASARSSSTTLLKMILNHLQTVAIVGALRVEWPVSVGDLYSGVTSVSSFSSDGLAFECLESRDGAPGGLSGAFVQNLIILFSPAALTVYAAGFWLVVLATPLVPGLMFIWRRLQAQLCAARRADTTKPEDELAAHSDSTGAVASPSPSSPSSSPSAAPSSSSSSADQKGRTSLGAIASSMIAARRASKVAQQSQSLLAPQGRYPAPAGERCRLWTRAMKTSILVLTFLCHTAVTKAAFRLISCENVPSEGSSDRVPSQLRLSADLDVRCEPAGEFLAMASVSAVVLVGFSLGVPALLGLSLARKWVDPQNPTTRELLGFLVDGYRRGFEGWEAVIIVRKVAMTAVTVLLAPFGATLQILGLLTVVIVSVELHAWLKPFQSDILNRHEMLSLSVIAVSLLGAMAIDATEGASWADVIVLLLVLAGNIVFFVVSFAIVLRRINEATNGRLERIGSHIERFVSRLKPAQARGGMDASQTKLSGPSFMRAKGALHMPASSSVVSTGSAATKRASLTAKFAVANPMLVRRT